MLWILGLLGVSGAVVIGVLILILIIIFAVVGGTSSDSESKDDVEFGVGNLSSHVLQYQPLVEKYAKEEGVAEHVPVILAIMQQESGGNPSSTDPMQSSESLCGKVGCITDPEHSIQQGVKHFKGVIEKAKGDLKLGIQSYNFGGGFIDYVQDKKGKYEFNKKLGDKETYDLAIKFSQEQYQRQISLGNGSLFSCLRAEAKPLEACYGDILYVWSVMQYVAPTGSGDWKNPLTIPINVSSPFGPRVHPITGEVGKQHNGTDMSCNRTHMPILSVDDGVVVKAQTTDNGGLGKHVIIKHDNNLYSAYGHLNSVSVSVKDKVKVGKEIGKCGNTGASKGIHLHLEARTQMNGGHFDAMKLLEGKKDKKD